MYKLPVNLFDFLLIGILVGGVLRGRKRGMSEELLGVLAWIGVVIGCAFAYEPLGQAFAQSSPVFGMLSCYLMAYFAGALLIFGIFALVKKALGGKLLGSDVFGQAEYYLGMGAGLLRFSCILLALLALLNARLYSDAEIRAMDKFQKDEYGSNYFPGLQTMQSIVFERSLTGPWIKDNLAFLLIKPTPPENKQLHQKEFTMP